MHPINKAVQKLIPMMEECGIEDSPVVITPDYDLSRCAYERGVPVQVIFGGRSAVFVSEEPIKVKTKASFMGDAPLKKSVQRGAAAGIINAVSGFLCLNRILHACSQEKHSLCRDALSESIRGKRIYCCGEMPDAKKLAGNSLVAKPEEADIILISGDGLVENESEFFNRYSPEKVIFIGPSTSGTAHILKCQHFCPFGRANLQTYED